MSVFSKQSDVVFKNLENYSQKKVHRLGGLLNSVGIIILISLDAQRV